MKWSLRALASAACAMSAAAAAGSSASTALAVRPTEPSCTMAAAGVGALLTLTGSGYRAGASYRVEFVWPNGNGVADTASWADGSGDIAVSTYAYWTGTYQASVYATTGQGSALTSCSLVVS